MALTATDMAWADAPAAPSLSTQAAHKVASDAMSDLLQKLPQADRQRIVGTYVAFQPDAKDVLALAACDDDGDYVVVVSDALLSLADGVARALAVDEIAKTHKLEDYAAHVAKEQRPGERLVTPPAGFFEKAHATREVAELQAKKYRALVTHLLAQELAHPIAGDLVCPQPTATHERGDDVWTALEQKAALAGAQKVNDPRRVVTADAVGTGYALETGAAEEPAGAFLSPFMATIEANARAKDSLTYLRLHPASTVRAQVVRTAAHAWHKAHAKEAPP
jgi:hypothetical protein